MTQPRHTEGATELLPCPFCGESAANVYAPTCNRRTPYDASHRAFPIVRCRACGAEAQGTDWDESNKSAVAKWNARPQRAHEPYLCIAPACGEKCSACNSAISPQEMRTNAVRYALLQRMDPRFGMPAKWLSFKTLDEAVDSELVTPPAPNQGAES